MMTILAPLAISSQMESEIPADEDAHGTEGRLDHFVWGVR